MSKFCPDCGTPNDDASVFCINCGARFPSLSQGKEQPEAKTNITEAAPSESEKPHSSKAGGKTALILCIAAVAVIAAVFAGLFFTGTADRMIASAKAGRGDYIGALESYEKYLSRSGNKSSEAITQAALYALSAGDADKALMYSKSVPENDAQSAGLKERSSIALAREAINREDWDTALYFLESVSSSDAKALAADCYLKLAERAASEKDWDAALDYLSNVSGSNAEELASDCYLKMGESAASEKNWETAISFLEKAGNSKAASLIEECRYHMAEEAEEKGEYEKAISILENCSYSDAENLLKKVRYNYGVALMKAENWELAAQQFSKTDYADSAELLEKCSFATSADSRFLSDLVTFCRGMSDAGIDADEISSLMSILEPYSSAGFKDQELAKCAEAFISDMQSYKKILSSNSRMYYKQIDMCTPLGDASNQLIRINKLHPFSSKDWSDISDFFDTPEYWKELAEVVRQIASDMGKKASSGPYGREHQFIKVPNNTSYEVTVTFWFYCYDKNNKLYSTDEVNVTLAKGKKTQVIFECNAYKCPSWGYDFYVISFR